MLRFKNQISFTSGTAGAELAPPPVEAATLVGVPVLSGIGEQNCQFALKSNLYSPVNSFPYNCHLALELFELLWSVAEKINRIINSPMIIKSQRSVQMGPFPKKRTDNEEVKVAPSLWFSVGP